MISSKTIAIIFFIIILLLIYDRPLLCSNYTEKFENTNQPNNDFSMNNEQNTFDDNLNSLISEEEQSFENPLFTNINRERNITNDLDQSAIQSLMNEIRSSNDLNTDVNFDSKINSPNHATNGYKKISYADSNYRNNFNGDGVSVESQNKLDKLYDQAIVFQNSEYSDNSNFTGNNETNDNYGPALLGDFKTNSQKSQKEKLLNMFDSNNYLPNQELTNQDLTKGFQILENPVTVSNPNLIPVQRSIPVSSTLGSKRNSSRDIRGDVPNPKTVVAPWNNSSINPDIYSSNRGCL
jgi:hypothetical protein